VQNQIHPTPHGLLVVDTTKRERLLVPAGKSHVSSPPAPDPGGHEVDHYACYAVKEADESEFAPIAGVELLDQFIATQLLGPAKRFDLRKPTRLCAPVDKDGSGIKHPATHLMCYKAVGVKGEPKHVKVSGLYLNDQFGPRRLDTVQEEELCVPSAKIEP
jgi:hypothetical protein